MGNVLRENPAEPPLDGESRESSIVVHRRSEGRRRPGGPEAIGPIAAMARKRKDKAADPEVLVVGLQNSGKTLLVRRLKAHLVGAASATGKSSSGSSSAAEATFSTDAVPTIGVDVDTVKGKKRSLTVREVGGAMKPLWPTYFDSCAAAVFCIDVSDESTMASAAAALVEAASHESLRGRPIIAALTKLDAPVVATRAEVWNLMPAGELPGVRWFGSSAYTGDGTREIAQAIWESIEGR